ncbi:TIGR04255 family protein, partial [Aurantimonas sp. 22II-16-19i]|uniref:TIGR04255 family protein n=1 Tax=Aurantimonas sp. 22II-16-19i TaxID=1317114 RepID=UPI00111C4634
MFVPISDHHAIQEVVFALTFKRQFPLGLLEQLTSIHKEIKRELPRMERPQVFQFAIGGGPVAPPQQAPSPVSFEAYKRDGSLDWRMMADGNTLVVNCLTYTNWADVSKRSLSLIHNACNVIMQQGTNDISHIALQYVDVFKWGLKSEDYDISLLLDSNSENIPKSLFRNVDGPLWHHHQGWFRPFAGSMEGNLLQRTHLDAMNEG